MTTFSDIAATVTDLLNVPYDCPGHSLKNRLFQESAVSDQELVEAAKTAMKQAYAPYSRFHVGAALLDRNGKVYTGCNIENSSLTPTVCAERTAFFKAISEGVRDFEAIAVVGGPQGEINEITAPCGVCRQVMTEFCDPDSFRILLGHADGFKTVLLKELLPYGFKLKEI